MYYPIRISCNFGVNIFGNRADPVNSWYPENNYYGANTVMRDAALLTKVLGEKGVSRESITEYEAEKRRYAGETIRMSAKVGQMSFGQRALEKCESVDV